MRKWMLILLILVLLPSTLAAIDNCGYRVNIGNNCTIITPSLNCGVQNWYRVYNQTAEVFNGTLKVVKDDIYKFTFNNYNMNLTANTLYVTKLCDGSTRETLYGGNISSTMIAIMIFIGTMIIILGGATVMFDKVLKFFFLLLTGLMVVVGLNLASIMAGTVNPLIEQVLWRVYTMSLWLLVILVLYFLIYALNQLKIKKQEAGVDNVDGISPGAKRIRPKW